MARIVVINQPINNRGDQAAHKSFMELLIGAGYEVDVVFSTTREYLGSFCDGISGVNYICIPPLRGETRLRRITEKRPLLTKVFFAISPSMRKIRDIIRGADYVVCAPGGVCMGAYKSWRHVNLLELAVRNNTHVSIWGRSIGPFNEQGRENSRFKKISVSILDQVDFISLRDKKSQSLAETLGLSYCPTIDTAFATTPHEKLPAVLAEFENEEYFVLVPNKLYEWQPYFKDVVPEQMDLFFAEIMRGIASLGYKILMLPQLFNCGKKDDIHYFRSLKELSGLGDKVVVLSDEFSSDVQQAIIRHSKMLVGARYHSVIFSINNAVPFICLSYEHKMLDTLKLLDLDEYSFDLHDVVTHNSHNLVLERISLLLKNADVVKSQIEVKRTEAKQIVLDAFDQFRTYLNSVDLGTGRNH